MLGTIINLILQFLSGAIGGNLAGAAKSVRLSTLLKTLAGAVGGVLGGQILGMFVPLLANTAASPDTAATIGQIATGGVAGAVLTAILGTLKKGTA
jgi:CDP-diglyceride synthetase